MTQVGTGRGPSQRYSSRMVTAALVLAAGSGERLGHSLPKAFVSLRGSPIVLHSLEAMAQVDEVDWVVPVIPAHQADLWRELALDDEAGAASETLRAKLCAAVAGGARRQDSVAAGVAALPATVEWVAVHDAARCLVARNDVQRVIERAHEHGAAILAEPARDTIKRVRGGLICETPPRDECWAAQTPQVFRAEILREALAKAKADGMEGTDDAQLVERLGVAVRVVESRSPNWKITLPEDLARAERWLEGAAGGQDS